MARTALLCDRGWRIRDLPVIKESFQDGPGSIRIRRRKISDFLDTNKLVEVSLAELALVKENEFVFSNLVFILPAVTICSARTEHNAFCKRARSENYLWHCGLRSRMGNRGIRRMKRLMNDYQIRVLLSGVWVIEGSVQLHPITKMIERVNSWATSL